MLTISKPLNAGQAQTYHAKEFTSPDQNYWQKGDVNLGEWQGQMAESFGLSGPVDAEHFARLSQGQHPATGEQLVKHKPSTEYTTEEGKTVKPVEHRAGWDATFSAPKSVSLAALVGGDDRVREAHREAVTAALTELERYTQARIGGNNAAETTGKFVAAKFEHDTARPVDGYAAPQLHTHAVIFNMTERENGKARALQARSLFDTQQFATAVYQSELTFRLRNLGYELEAGRSGAPEIKGFTREYLDASSPRSQQIREYLEANGFKGPEAAQIAAHGTRDGKEFLSTDQVMAAHYKVAELHGNQAARIVAGARERAYAQPEQSITDAPSRAQQAVTYAKERGFEREAVSDERLLMRDALRRAMGDVTYPEIRRNFDQRVSAGEFRGVDSSKHATGRRFTTPETIGMERAAIQSLRLGQDTMDPIMPAAAAREQAASQPKLNDGQRQAIQEILTTADRVHGLQGLAGTGKTTTLRTIREGAEGQGYAVEGFAPTSKAANELRDAGISAGTLQHFLKQGGQDRTAGDPASRHLYMLDESSLASTRQMRDFLQKIGPQDRVLVIGDTRQHQGVDAGKPFEQMQDAGMRTSRLDRIVRQQDPALLAAVERLSRNETAAGVQLLKDQGRVRQIVDREERIAAIAKDFAANPQRTLIVSPDNASRRELNKAVRSELQRSGVVSFQTEHLPTLISRSDLTGADRQWAAKYQAGDVLHYTAGSKDLGIKRGSYANVTAVNTEANRLTVRREDGREVTYDPRRLQGVTAYQEIGRDFAKGDRIQFTAPVKDLGVANRDLATIVRLDGETVTAKLDSKDGEGKKVRFNAKQMRHFDHGYAVTSHSSQGVTAERVLVNMDTRAHPELINTRFAYVSVSRASQDARLYTNDAEALGHKLSRDASKTSALDFRNQQVTKQTTQPNHKEKTMEQDQQRGFQPEDRSKEATRERVYTPAEHERHYAPLNRELHAEDAQHFGWRAENGTVQSYQHDTTLRHIHIDGPTGQFFDQQKNPISQRQALDYAMGPGTCHAVATQQAQEAAQRRSEDQSMNCGL